MDILTLISENVYLAWLSNSVRLISLELNVLSYIMGLLMGDVRMVNSPTIFVIKFICNFHQAQFPSLPE